MPVPQPTARTASEFVTTRLGSRSKPTGIAASLPARGVDPISAMLPGSLYYLRKDEEVFGYKAKVPTLLLQVYPAKLLNLIPNRWRGARPLPDYILYENFFVARLRKQLERKGGPIERLGLNRVQVLLKSYGSKAKVTAKNYVKEYCQFLVPRSGSLRGGRRNEPIRGLHVQGGEVISSVKVGAAGSKQLRVRFALIGLDANKLPVLEIVDPRPYLRLWPTFNPQTKDHPIIKWVLRQAVNVNFHLRFEYPIADKYVSIKWKPKVKLQVNGATLLSSDKPDSKYVYHFTLSNTLYARVVNKKLHFQIELGGKIQDGVTFPNSWTTADRRDLFGRPGSYSSFPGVSPSTASNPLTFRIFESRPLQLQYVSPYIVSWQSSSPDVLVHVPRGLRAVVREYHNHKLQREQKLRTDKQGRIFPVFLNKPKPLLTRLLVVQEEIVDSKISLPSTQARYRVKGMETQIEFKKHLPPDRNWNPTVVLRGKYTVAGLYMLKVLKETHNWLWRMTAAAGETQQWQGIPLRAVLWDKATPRGKPGAHANWPTRTYGMVGSLEYQVVFERSLMQGRSTIIHEYGHIVLDKLCDIGPWNMTLAMNRNKVVESHDWNLISNRSHALNEGFAEFLQGIFGSYDSVFKIQDKINDKLEYPNKKPGPKLRDARHPLLGLKVEGAIANALFRVFSEVVLGQNLHGKRYYQNQVGQDRTGETQKIPYLPGKNSRREQQIQQDFYRLILQPLVMLTSYTYYRIDSKKYFDSMERKATPPEWKLILPILQGLNIRG